MKRKREAETEEQTKLQRKNNKLAMRRKPQAQTEEKTAPKLKSTNITWQT